MASAVRYRSLAVNSLRLARRARSLDDRILMVSIASGWLRLAEQAEQAEQSQGGAPDPDSSPGSPRPAPQAPASGQGGDPK